MLQLGGESAAEIDKSNCQGLNGAHLKKYHCVEMKPVKALPIYQFKLYQLQDSQGAVLFVKTDSQIIEYLKTDCVFDMKFLPKNRNARQRSLPTMIRSISKEDRGPFKGHLKVRISIAREQ